MTFSLANVNLVSLLPEIILLISAAGIIFLSGRSGRKIAPAWALAAVIAAGVAGAFLLREGITAGFNGLIIKDRITFLFLTLVDTAAVVTFLISPDSHTGERDCPEYYGLALFAVAGMHFMASGHDFLVIFLGLEILALPLYILVGFKRKEQDGMEGAIKYFLLGSFSSAVFLLGTAFYYGASGTTELSAILKTVAVPSFLFIGLTFILVGIGFKIAAAPFHMWAPDVYEGAPVPVAAYISVLPKIAGFVVLVRIGFAVISQAGKPGTEILSTAIIVIAVASMIIGNLAALKQTGFIRMLAYSGIAQVGYILLGLLAEPGEGMAAVSFYLLVYIFMNLGAFAVAVYVRQPQNGHLQISDFSALGSRKPLLAFALTVFMISLAGLPPTGGFFAKFYIFKAAISAGFLPVVIVAIVMSIISLFYYLKVVMVVYMENETASPEMDSVIAAPRGLMLAFIMIVLLTGILPGNILQLIRGIF